MDNKNKKRGRPVLNDNKLSKEIILAQTKLLLKENGKIPSIRAVARELTVDTMAIYHYYINKTFLLEAVTVSLLEEIYQPVVSSAWESELRKLCQSYLNLLVENNGLLEILLSMESTEPVGVFSQRVSSIFNESEISEDRLKNVINLLVDFLHGFSYSLNCDSSNTLQIEMSNSSIELIICLIKSKCI